MLHLACAAGFPVDVGCFFQFQRSFESRRVIVFPADEKEILRIGILLCRSPYGIAVFKYGLNLLWNGKKLL